MPLSEPTWCDDCEHVEPASRKQPPWRWLCLKNPRLEGFGFVTREKWDDFPPFLYCKDLNGGACPLYTRAAPGQLKLVK